MAHEPRTLLERALHGHKPDVTEIGPAAPPRPDVSWALLDFGARMEVLTASLAERLREMDAAPGKPIAGDCGFVLAHVTPVARHLGALLARVGGSGALSEEQVQRVRAAYDAVRALHEALDGLGQELAPGYDLPR